MADSHCDDYGSEDMSDDVSTEELSDEELDVQLREVADKFIDLANQQAQRFHKENVSQGMMYGTARFNAFVVASHADDVLAYDEDRDRAIEYFVGQYRQMLISNLDDYRGSFEDLKYAHLMSRRPN
ncbi:MAG TPA: DUF3144 domain-containing protein [Gammaproteobacteria bacterium]|jgi:hypothetical protein|nr:hypothetical protein [Acidiferrobacter sp.]HAF73788.1 DUF3144 domain-containing protein [Gammaproteobacteria bacterium]|tara:strand:+ start:447 stop:824 length:378 start_codon:yes stop_codon:yes gene_type:complete